MGRKFLFFGGSILPMRPGQGGWALGGMEERHDEGRGGEGLDTAISI